MLPFYYVLYKVVIQVTNNKSNLGSNLFPKSISRLLFCVDVLLDITGIGLVSRTHRSWANVPLGWIIEQFISKIGARLLWKWFSVSSLKRYSILMKFYLTRFHSGIVMKVAFLLTKESWKIIFYFFWFTFVVFLAINLGQFWDIMIDGF